MRKILHLFLTATLLFALAGTAKAQTDAVIYSGDGTSDYVPTWTGWSYGFAEYIINYANMPGTGGTYCKVFSISFYFTGQNQNGGAATYNRDLRIYLKNVSTEEFTDDYMYEPVNNNDLYFAGNVTASAEGWVTLTLNRPFNYKNISGNHMLLAISDYTGSYAPEPRPLFKKQSTSNNRGVRYHNGASDGEIDITNPSSSSSGNSLCNFLPALKINYRTVSAATMPYYCNFEDATERNDWMLKNTTDNMNAGWYTYGSSNHSLLCGDGQGNANYQISGQSVTVLAERGIHLSQADQIVISFDLNVGGENYTNSDGVTEYCYDYLIAYLAPYDENWEPSTYTTTYTGYNYEWDLPYALHFGSEDLAGIKLTFKNGERMQTVIDNPGKGSNYKLIFVWRNDNSGGDGTAATIDNVAVEDYVTYDLKVGSTLVTTLNKGNIVDNALVAGNISFNPENNTITMNNATLDTYSGMKINNGYGETTIVNPVIKLIGDNDILGGIDLDDSHAASTGLLTIEGSGKLDAEYLWLTNDINLLVKDCELFMNEQNDAWCLYGYGDNNFTFNNAKAHFAAGSYAIGDFNNLNLVNCEIVVPQNALIAAPTNATTYTSNFVCNSDGTAATVVEIDRVQGIAQNEAETLNVYPNPANDVLFIEGADGETVMVYDNTGRVVMEAIYNGSLDVSQLSQGIYAATMNGRTVKFVKE